MTYFLKLSTPIIQMHAHKLRINRILINAGIREIGEEGKSYRERIDITSPLPWWRQIHDTKLLHHSTPDVYIGAMDNMNPSNDNLPIFDTGHFWEDRAELAHEYLEKYYTRNSDILSNPESNHRNIELKYRNEISKEIEHIKHEKTFFRTFKKRKEIIHRDLKTANFQEKDKLTERNQECKGKIEENRALMVFNYQYDPPPTPKEKLNPEKMIERELHERQDNPYLAYLIPEEWDGRGNGEVSNEPNEELWSELGIFEIDKLHKGEFDMRAINAKKDRKFFVRREWRAWQERNTSYNGYDGGIGRDVRCRERHNYENRFPMNGDESFSDQDLLDAVMCVHTPTPGCNPKEFLDWMDVRPPTSIFRYTDLPGEIGYRRLLNTEEWLEQHGMIIKRKMFTTLHKSSVISMDKKYSTSTEIKYKKNQKNFAESETLPEFIPKKKYKFYSYKPWVFFI
eukprot:gnl/TRDRNA2_/TRDRNA2_176620_c0_seq1.p1 gnl/TRDRNA2_/TRDRNA2_176620_c0~~gnl/TRDRNA2_/TRDRNA2_176620_c0_seq1.p1  ORF type:complete len:454 (-),score=-5.86 gnl/TRDRNA2_/TRDRNA2_176620_c0_seq1:221-1582(-)